jgi:hypothetical protein
MFVSMETPFRGEAATGILFARAGFKPLANDAKVNRFAEFVKGVLILADKLPRCREKNDMEVMSAQPENAAQVLPFAQRAIRELGFVKEEAAEWFASFVFDHWRDSQKTFNWRRAEPQITDAEKMRFGYDRWAHVPLVLISVLTEKGLVDPLDCFANTFGRTRELHSKRWNFESKRDIITSGYCYFDHLRFIADSKLSCAAALSLNDNVLELDELIELPLPGCARLPCWCDFSLERRKT